jgi:hypothetical protein
MNNSKVNVRNSRSSHIKLQTPFLGARDLILDYTMTNAMLVKYY